MARFVALVLLGLLSLSGLDAIQRECPLLSPLFRQPVLSRSHPLGTLGTNPVHPVPLPSFPSQLGGGAPGFVSGGGSGGVRREWGGGATPGRQLPRDVGREPLARPDGTAWVGTEYLGADVVQGGRGGGGSLFRWFAGLWLPPAHLWSGGRAGGSQRAGLRAANGWRQRVGFGGVAASVCRPAGILRAWSFQQEPGRFTCPSVLFPK